MEVVEQCLYDPVIGELTSNKNSLSFHINEQVFHKDYNNEIFVVKGINLTNDKILIYGDWSGIGLSYTTQWVYANELIKSKIVKDV